MPPHIEDDVAENYRQLRVDTGRSWSELAEQFDRDAAALPDEHAAPYRRLADWARAQDDDVEPAEQPPAEPTEAEKAAAEAAAKAEADAKAEAEKAAKAAKTAA